MQVDASLVQRILALPSKVRAELASEIILSLEDEPFDDDAEGAWAAEIVARIARLERGEAKIVDFDKSLDRMRRKLKAHRMKVVR